VVDSRDLVKRDNVPRVLRQWDESMKAMRAAATGDMSGAMAYQRPCIALTIERRLHSEAIDLWLIQNALRP